MIRSYNRMKTSIKRSYLHESTWWSGTKSRTSDPPSARARRGARGWRHQGRPGNRWRCSPSAPTSPHGAGDPRPDTGAGAGAVVVGAGGEGVPAVEGEVYAGAWTAAAAFFGSISGDRGGEGRIQTVSGTVVCREGKRRALTASVALSSRSSRLCMLSCYC